MIDQKELGKKYTYEERLEMLKKAMGNGGYEAALKDLAPFEGGMSEYYEIYKIPTYIKD
jgi:hypothetical protein